MNTDIFRTFLYTERTAASRRADGTVSPVSWVVMLSDVTKCNDARFLRVFGTCRPTLLVVVADIHHKHYPRCGFYSLCARHYGGSFHRTHDETVNFAWDAQKNTVSRKVETDLFDGNDNIVLRWQSRPMGTLAPPSARAVYSTSFLPRP